MNNYVVVTNDKITLEEKIKEINKNNDAEIVYYDLLEVNIERLIEDLDTINFLSSKKIIVGTNAYFLSTDKNKGVEHNLDLLEKYLSNPNGDNYLILVTDNLDKRKKIVTSIIKKCEVIEEISDIDTIIKKHLGDYKMDFKAINTLKEYCSNNNERIINEIDKLKLYKIDDKTITLDDVKEIVKEDIDDNIFHFVDSILDGNKEYAFKMYHNFILNGETVIKMIALLSNKIRLIYQVKVLSNMSDKDIALSLKVHEYPVKLARSKAYKYSENKLLEYLYKLSKLDLDIKSGESTGEVEFETLLAAI